MTKSKVGFRAVVACLLLLVLVGTTTIMAQDENIHSLAQEIDETPVEVSRTETPDGVNTVVEIPVRMDTYVASNQPGRNWCTSNWLRLGYNRDGDNLGAERIFLWFDLSSIPSEAAIHSAKFKIYMHTATPPGDSNMRVESRHLATPWDECSVTWNSHQPHWGHVFGSSWIGSATGWLEADATELVRDWVYGTHANYGAMLMGDETVRDRQRIFYSREDTASPSRYPRLVVDYSVHVDNEPPQVSVYPLPKWSHENFTVSWGGTDPGGSGINYFDVQYRIAGRDWISWLNHTKQASAQFLGGANGYTYEFRARGVDNAGNVQPWSSQAQAWTIVDAVPPTASVNPLDPIIFSSSALISWTGSDNIGGSGIKYYDIQFQENGGPWQDWQMGTTATSYFATGGVNGVTYGFRARAVDNAGNAQSWSHVAQASTTVNSEGPIASIVPFDPNRTDEEEFTVRWQGDSAPTTPIVYYDVRYRIDNGSWILWQSETTQLSALFTKVGPDDGLYCFDIRATDSAGRTSDYMGQVCIAIDRYAPFLEPRAHMPIIPKSP